MMHSRATIYSNGIADFQRIYSITSGQPHKVSIPVRQQHLADVLASLTVSGSVRVDAPPCFQPANMNDSNVVISADDSFVDLVQQLVGAEVEITQAKNILTGKLAGIQDHQTGTDGHPITEKYLVLLTESGLTRLPIRNVDNLHFTDETIRSEITKALNQSLQAIKPNSTFLELVISTTKKSTTAIVQYAIPAAAWKLSYRLILTQDKPLGFHGHAIVDNNTDEDWKDFLIAVVMGQPITFSTDLAESKTPRRHHVNVVQDSTIGSIEIESASPQMNYSQLEEDSSRPSAAAVPMARKKRSIVADERFQTAEVETLDVTENGDFCIFESATPVSIAAHRSALIPVFQTTLEKSKPILHYRRENHAERPFRTIQFENTTPHSLSRGVCTVYDQQTFVGNCILPTIGPGGTAMLAHALETAVSIRCQPGKIESRRIGIRLSDGVAYENYHKLLRTEYVINNQRDEPFQFVLDHETRLDQCNVACQVVRDSTAAVDQELEVLTTGRRVSLELFSKDKLKVVFVETCVAKSQVHLTGISAADEKFRVVWLYDNLIDANLSLAQDPAIRKCTDLQRELDEKNDQIEHARDELQRLIGRQQRLRENIKVGAGDPQTARYQDDLARAEDNLVQLEEEHLPELVVEREQCRRELYQALKNLALEWNE